MKTLTDYIVTPALYQQAGGLEAQVGDQVKLYLDTDAQPGFPEFILGIIQHPIVRVCDGTAYAIEYNEADLIVAEAIHPDDVVSAEVFQAWDQLAAVIDAEIARATAAEAALTSQKVSVPTVVTTVPLSSTFASQTATVIAFATDEDTLTIGDEVWTFVAGSPGALQIEIGVSPADQRDKIVAALAASEGYDVSAVSTEDFTVVSKQRGVSGDFAAMSTGGAFTINIHQSIEGIDGTSVSTRGQFVIVEHSDDTYSQWSGVAVSPINRWEPVTSGILWDTYSRTWKRTFLDNGTLQSETLPDQA